MLENRILCCPPFVILTILYNPNPTPVKPPKRPASSPNRPPPSLHPPIFCLFHVNSFKSPLNPSQRLQSSHCTDTIRAQACTKAREACRGRSPSNFKSAGAARGAASQIFDLSRRHPTLCVGLTCHQQVNLPPRGQRFLCRKRSAAETTGTNERFLSPTRSSPGVSSTHPIRAT